jgi:hypothetical protein
MKEVVYVGSSAKGLSGLEYNHRNASELSFNGQKATMSRFRTALKEQHEDQGNFVWLSKPELRTEKEVLQLEEEFQGKYKPRYNKDYFPLQSREKRGNVLDERKIYRGVYGFEV